MYAYYRKQLFYLKVYAAKLHKCNSLVSVIIQEFLSNFQCNKKILLLTYLIYL